MDALLRWHVSPQRFASDSASQKFRRDTVPLPVLLGHTNRSVKLSHESQREIMSSFRHFQDQFLTTNKDKWGKKNGPVFRKVSVFDVSRAVGIARFESVSESQPHRTIQCHCSSVWEGGTNVLGVRRCKSLWHDSTSSYVCDGFCILCGERMITILCLLLANGCVGGSTWASVEQWVFHSQMGDPLTPYIYIYILNPNISKLGREPPLTLRQDKQYLYFGHLFPYARAFFPVVRRFF